MLDNKGGERRQWSQREDDALKELYESLKINKWSHIAQQLESRGFTGRTGKQCRERYNNHLDPSLSRDEWSFQEEKKLYTLHDELGNKWAVISQRLSTGRTDNTIKNHFYSRLRKSVRRLNQVIQERYKKELREIQTKVLYKVIEASEEKFKAEPMCDPELSEYSCKLKNKILMFSYEEGEGREGEARQLIEEIIGFNRNYKRKPKKFRKVGSSYDHIDQGEKLEAKQHYCSLDFPERAAEPPATSFSSFASKNREGSGQGSDSDDINAVVVETQKQKMISPIILTGKPLPQREKVQNSEQILEALGLLEDDLSMPHPIFLKKKTSVVSSELSQDMQQFKFFDDSSAEMKLMLTPVLPVVKRQSMEEGLFH